MPANLDDKGVRDVHKKKATHSNWKDALKNGGQPFVKTLSPGNTELILEYLSDMESGLNASKNKRGARSYNRLATIRTRMPTIAAWIAKYCRKDMIDISYAEAMQLFGDLTKGKITKSDGQPYDSAADYVRQFKSFWNWLIRSRRRKYYLMPEEQREKLDKKKWLIENISEDLDDSQEGKPKFVYLNEKQFARIRDAANFDYRVMLNFLMDSGVRSPSELMNIRVSDIAELPENPKIALLDIRPEITKTFARKFKLMFCWPQLKDYIERGSFGKSDFIFTKHPAVVNRYLRRLAFKELGIGEKVIVQAGKGKERDDVKGGLSMYDLRHCSACFWLLRYKNHNSLMYRMGWRDPAMVEYYSSFLGMKDSIGEGDLLSSDEKTQLERELQEQRSKYEMLEEQMRREQQRTLGEQQRMIEKLEKIEKFMLIEKEGIAKLARK